jgi:SpoIID/LytB domain protein
MRRTALAALLALALGLPAAAPAAAEEPTTAAATVSDVQITGRGWGHGRGMGQYGAYGYARDHGWNWQQITDHFYGGTTLGAIDAGLHVDALLKGQSGRETLVRVASGSILTNVDHLLPPLQGRQAVAVVANPDGSFTVRQSTDCATWDAGTRVTPAPINGRSILVTKHDGADPRMTLCGGATYRGELWIGHFATTGTVAGSTSAKQHVMNHVWVEAYLRSVVPSESPASWPFDALAAQAIAARSYVAAGDARYGWATTCDDIFCQVYRGVSSEAASTDAAVAATAGQVRRTGGGGVARTEFSSSTGGFTAGGTFPAVVDEGDDVSANPNHNWSTSVRVSSIETAFDTRHGRDMGALQALTVLERNDLPAPGEGRVVSIRADFTGGTSTVSGNTFRSMFGLKSDWFTSGALQPDAGFSDTAGHTHEANIDKVAAAGIASGFSDGTFRPDDLVTRAQMATFIAKGWQLAAAESPFTDTDGDVHEANIGAVAAAGITSGCTTTTYCPTANITRGQMAVFLARAEDLAPVDGDGGLCDVDGHPFEPYIRAVVQAGYASGNNGCFLPDNPVTRGQMATFLARALGL